MKQIKLLIAFLCFSFLFSCKQDDQKIEFTLLQVNDVYEIAPIQGGKYGGMARLETIRQELLKENSNTMLVMAGDFLNPSLLGTMKYEGDRIRGKQMVEVMNAMSFEVVAFGNHEFDLSNNDLQKRMDESKFPWIIGNAMNVKGDSLVPFYQNRNEKTERVKGSYIKEISDKDGTTIKIGFISVCIPSNPRSYVKYTDMYEEIQREYNEIKDKVDIVFGLTHVKVEQDKKIAELLPKIPLIMGGHEHTHKNETVGEVSIRKADANAKSAYIHKVTYDQKEKKTSITSTLKEITDEIASDATVKRVVDKWQTIMDNQISQVVENPYDVIYTTDVPLDGRDTPIRSVQTNLGEIVTKSMAFSYQNKVDCSIVNGGSIRIDDELIGDINSVDIFRVLPYGGEVYKVQMKGSLLSEVLDFGKNAAGTGAYLQRDGILYENNQWKVNQNKINPNKTYTVAISDFLLKGLDIPFLTEDNKGIISIYKPNTKELAYDIRKGVIAYLKTLN
ncbi:bifunctional metallophosphatase/5'-nucleotidase [Pseudotenacibaculum sp. MALMAid0570]|uniref:bifunctional metallophosphatase/5'-nucleotidase n=1 Tax=Pseudotenacibaculum sp. MALMAid0570 TaxID=3143938 RepID=UPI0032DF359D